MNPDRVRQMLQQTLDDARLSRSEKTVLSKIFGHVEPTSHEAALYRNIAFALARDALNASNARQIVDWLEDVTKVLAATSGSGNDAHDAEACFSPGDACPQRIAGLLRTARNSVDICVFTITDDRISSAIEDAHRRQVAVRIITDDEKAGDLGSDIVRLSRAGIPVRIDRTRHHMHHKFALFDNRLLLTGSYNWTRSAAINNEENFVVTGDQRLIGEFADVFGRLWERFA